MDQQIVTLGVAGLGIAGTLASPILTQRLARRSQREQWERDKQTEEYRELLNALTSAYLDECAIARLAAMGLMREEDDGEIEPTDAESTLDRLLRNRLFTAIDLDEEDVIERWRTALYDFRRDGLIEKFTTRYRNISSTIVWLSTQKGRRPEHM